MIKLRDLITEKSYKNSKDFGKGGMNDRQYYTVTKTFTFDGTIEYKNILQIYYR